MTSMVSIDIETTGLDSKSDSIIEIGAVRFSDHRIEAEFSTLVNPGRPIPAAITQLTHITNDMVRNAPSIRAVLPELIKFVGNAPVVGHNVRFDLSFLNLQGALVNNEIIDTYELATVLFPTATRYNLFALGQQLGIMLPPNEHRALDDSKAAHSVFLKLYEKASNLPIDLLAEFVRLGEQFDWGGSYLFQQIFRARAHGPISARQAREHATGALFSALNQALFPPLNPVDQPTPLDVDEVASILEYGGPFARYFPEYEQRDQQVSMLRRVTEALSNSQHLLVEAGTGTGKSFAYLVPAAMWAIQNGMRVVISTNTINLQDQLIKKDIPDLKAALNLDLRATVLKGRSNYLCPRRLENLRQRGPENMDEMRVLAKILIWLMEGGTGDRGEINLNGPYERAGWSRVSAEDEGCKGEICLGREGGACPFFRARQAALSSHLIIVNHALLLADVATGNRVLPEYHHLIVDEAHHLESATTSALSFKVTQLDISRLLRELGGSSNGVLGHLMSIFKSNSRPSELAAFAQMVQKATDYVFRLEHDYQAFFHSIEEFLAEQRDGKPISSYGQEERILPATRTQHYWTDVEISWDSAHEIQDLLLDQLNQINKAVGELQSQIQSEDLEDEQGDLADILLRLLETGKNLHALVTKPDENYVYWAEISPNGNQLALNIAPLHIGSLMEKYLWHEKESVILTSATLTTNGEFDYLRSRLNADEADEIALDSPFDYPNSALLYLCNDIPEPSDPAYQRAVEQTIVRLAKATGGRMLVLFTSYSQLKKTSGAISTPLAAEDIQVYEQGEGASANTLLENFRGAEKAVLLGTRAFWEGVDIAGEALSVLVIVKLPFDVPSDPIIAARSETFDDPFNEYNLPEAILRFRQGFGRLIRTQSDRGVVAILDRRLLTKRYGKMFIESLPDCNKKIGSMQDLPALSARWLNL